MIYHCVPKLSKGYENFGASWLLFAENVLHIQPPYGSSLTINKDANVEHWVELGCAEVKALCKYRFSGLQLSEGELHSEVDGLSLKDYPEILSQKEYVWLIIYTVYSKRVG